MRTTFLAAEDLQVLFPDFFGAFFETEDKFLCNAAPTNSIADVDYLKRGERIETLARTFYQHSIKKMDLTDVEKQIFSFSTDKNMSYFDIVHAISKVFTRPCLRNMTKVDDKYAKSLIDSVCSPDVHVSISFADNAELSKMEPYVSRAVNSRKTLSNDTDSLLKVTFAEKGYSAEEYYGYKNTTHTKKDLSWYDSESYIHVVDIADFFSSLIIFNQVMKKVEAYKNACNEEYKHDTTYFNITTLLKVFPYSVLKKDVVMVCPENLCLNTVDELFNYPINVSEADYDSAKSLYDFLESKGATVNKCKGLHSWKKTFACKEPSLYVMHMDNLAACFLTELHFSYHYLTKNSHRLNHYWGLPQAYRFFKSKKLIDTKCLELFRKLFLFISEEKVVQRKTLSYYDSITKASHAKSYQLKKSISKRVLNAMKSSLFNEYFGFVEFDDETDTAKAEEIALEFRALKERYLKKIDASDNAIRFRKLGNHKALGLYYPNAKCLCVDIKSPESFIHEFGHLIDYTQGNLANMKEFMEIQTDYVSYLHMQMEKDEVTRKMMTGRTKYNLDYYSLPTEVFARCFELYVVKVLGVYNSIVPATFDQRVYPQENTFLDKIGRYFHALLNDNRSMNNITPTTDLLTNYIASDNNFVACKEATAKEV